MAKRTKGPTDATIRDLALAWHRAWQEYGRVDLAYEVDGEASGYALAVVTALGLAADEAERALRDALDEWEEAHGTTP